MKSESIKTLAPRPWYREPWPWILAAGPFLVIIAGVYTAWLAIKSNDGLVTEDYYKKGLAANQTIARNELATSLGLVAGVRIVGETMHVRLQAAKPDFTMPPALTVTISHPTRAGLDQSRVLPRVASGYAGEVRLPASGHWLVLVEDESKLWRLMGNVILPANGEAMIGAQPPEAKPEPADIRN
ncbi:MAG: FixH family protein [Rhodocyclales bacterium]|nr:FixH family protein [Rhodocyclales bacterium]